MNALIAQVEAMERIVPAYLEPDDQSNRNGEYVNLDALLAILRACLPETTGASVWMCIDCGERQRYSAAMTCVCGGLLVVAEYFAKWATGLSASAPPLVTPDAVIDCQCPSCKAGIAYLKDHPDSGLGTPNHGDGLPLGKRGVMTDSERLHQWRSWAQFVFGGGGKPSGTDTELQRMVCERYDAEPAALPEKEVTNETSDGYHTFNELYAYRKAYNALLFNEWAALGRFDVHKSWTHSDGEPCFGGGWFVVSAQTPAGQITNHYKAADWALFHIPERELATTWDGHTPAIALDRLLALSIAGPSASALPEKERELVLAAEALTAACEEDMTGPNTQQFTDDEPVGISDSPTGDTAVTFGMIRRTRAALNDYRPVPSSSALSPEPPDTEQS